MISTCTLIFFIEISFVLPDATAEATGLGFVCFAVINPFVLSANRVDLMFYKFSNSPPPFFFLSLFTAQPPDHVKRQLLPRYLALKTLGERKAAFHEYVDVRKREEKEERRLASKKAREEFILMLKDQPAITIDTRFRLEGWGVGGCNSFVHWSIASCFQHFCSFPRTFKFPTNSP